jgi:tetratricopeptide (TPR) repeat protein
MDQSEFQRAKVLLLDALSIQSSIPEFLNSAAVCLIRLGDLGSALDYADCAVQRRPHYVEAWANRGWALRELGQFEPALQSYEKALALDCDYISAWLERANVLCYLKRYDDALESFDKATQLKPSFAEAWSNRCNALLGLNLGREALASAEHAIEIRVDYAQAWSNRGNALRALGLFDAALLSYEKATQLKPDLEQAWNNQGNLLMELGRDDEALLSFERAISIDRKYAQAYVNKGLLLLRNKCFDAGFALYSWRWRTADYYNRKPSISIPEWTEASESSRNLLLWPEQGIGDQIFYTSMLSTLVQNGGDVALAIDKRLHSIVGRSFPTVELLDPTTVKLEERHRDFDAHAPVGQLGKLLKIDARKIDAFHRPYLKPDFERAKSFRTHLRKRRTDILCGLSWKSNNVEYGQHKSIRLENFEGLLRLSNVSFVNLQYGEVEEELNSARERIGLTIHQVAELDLYNDIDGLTSLIESCDFVLTTSNVTAHLAGSIGKKGVVLVPKSRGRLWYWHKDDVRSLWYPSLRICYQNQPGDWKDSVEQAIDHAGRDLGVT